jgi:hypothetical protein
MQSQIAHFSCLRPYQCRPAIFNYRSRSIQQSATKGSDSSSNPYTTAGLLGDSQIVSVGDTGLDLTSCYFSDSNGKVPFSSVYSPVFNTSYRKVIQYTYLVNYTDTMDEVEGHGTHVCGTIVGNLLGGDITTSKFDALIQKSELQTKSRTSIKQLGSTMGMPPMPRLLSSIWAAAAVSIIQE